MQTLQPTTRYPNQSVLPQIQIAQDSSDVVLQELRGQYWLPALQLFCTMYFIGFVVVLLTLFRSVTGLTGAGVNILFVLVVSILFFMFLRKLTTIIRFGPGKLILSRWPLHLGEDVKVCFVRDIRNQATIERLEARLVCTEVVSYKIGKRTHTKREVVWEQAFPITINMTTDTSIEGIWNMHIPPDAPPSLSVWRNAVIWNLEIMASGANLSNTTSSFTLLVRPEMV